MDEPDIYATILTFTLIGALLGATLVYNTNAAPLQRGAIERGYAQYNQTTGDWEWK
jgi:hypothetical protein